jgi:uncharacterized membrane protein YiaA
MKQSLSVPRASGAYAGATYACLGIGALGFCIGLWNATMELNEKGYYFTLLAFGLYAAVSLQKCIRDKAENIPISSAFLGLSFLAVGLSLLLLVIGLWNATLLLSEKGYYGMSFVLALFSAVTVQKNTRDNAGSAGSTSAAPVFSNTSPGDDD